MPPGSRRFTSSVFAWGVPAALCAAQPVLVELEPPPAQPVVMDEPAESTLQLSVSPYLWVANFDGSARVRNIRADVSINFIDTALNSDAAIGGQSALKLRGDGWFVYTDFSFMYAEQNKGSANQIDAIIPSDTQGEVIHYVLGGGVVVHEEREPRTRRLEHSLALHAGMRVTSVDVEINPSLLPKVEISELWFEPFVGAEWTMALTDQLGFTVYGNVGGFDIGSRLALRGTAVLAWDIEALSVPNKLYLGYQAIYQDYNTNDFHWDIVMHGPLFGFRIDF